MTITIAHIAVWTEDLECLKTFYEKYFQAQAEPLYVNAAKQFSSYFLRFDGGARLELMVRATMSGAARPADAPGYAHVALGVGSEAAVDALTRRLQQDGYAVVDGPRRTGDGYYESVVLDPDGNRLEITV